MIVVEVSTHTQAHLHTSHTPSQLNKPGRLDSDTVPTLQHSADIMDFTFDPFDNCRLVAGEPLTAHPGAL